jgi:hypothetical protein
VNNKLDDLKWEMVLANLMCGVCILLERKYFVYILCFPSQETVWTNHVCTERNSLESIINTEETFRFKTVTITVEDLLKAK